MPDIQCVRRITTYSAMAILVCCAISCGNKAKDALEQAEQRVRAAGQPVTLEELNAYYPEVPREQNAALVYGEAFDQFELIDPGGERSAALHDRIDELKGAPLPANLQEELRTHLASCARVFSTLDRAITLPKSRYSLDLRNGMDTQLPHLAKLRSCARLEALRSSLAMSENRPADFVRSQESMLHMAESLSGEPMLISQLVRIAIHSIANGVLAHSLSRATLPAQQLSSLQDACRRAEDPECVIRAYVGERCSMVDGLGRMGSGGLGSDTEVQQLAEGIRKSGIDFSDEETLSRQRFVIVKHLEPITQSAPLSWPERMQLKSKLKADIQEFVADDPSLDIFASALVSAIEAFGRDIVMLRSAQAALSVERFRADTGALPDDLGQLVPRYLPAPIEDPFDGQPLRYKRLSKGYQIYSVYADLKDDGGRQGERTDSGFVGDWVFEVRR